MPLPSIYSKINTNYVPTNEERITIRKLLAAPEARLRNLEGRISTLQAAYRNLVRERNVLRLRVDAHCALLAPIRRIPDDVLEEIFYRCLCNYRLPVMCTIEAPMLLGRICQRWRFVSLTSPRLWAAVHIPVYYDGESLPRHLTDNNTRIQAIAEWLSRSGNCPLSVSLYFPYRVDMLSNTTRDNDSVLQPYLDVLLPLIKRWKDICFSIPGFGWPFFFRDIKESDVPLLERLRIVDRGSQSPDHSHYSSALANAAKLSGLMRAPRLRAISIPRFGTSFCELPVRWSGLTELNLLEPAPSLVDLCHVLSHCYELRFCRLRQPKRHISSTEDIELSATLPHISLPKLLEFSMLDGLITHSSCFLEHIFAPSLRHLSFDWVSSTSAPDGARFRDALRLFAGRTAQPIEELWLNARSLSEGDVMIILSLLPGLKRLGLWTAGRYPDSPPTGYSFCFEDPQLRRFIPKQYRSTTDSDSESPPNWVLRHDSDGEVIDYDCLCPQLEVLHCTEVSFTGPALLEFLRSRSSPTVTTSPSLVVPLKEVDVHFAFGWQLSERIKQKIKKLEAETGIAAKIACSSGYVPPPFGRPVSAYDGIPRQTQWIASAYQTYFGF